jgi:diaminohydroxyphosphoribosylaminopyrimidine deaminase/5-amino-6-(5-phosphoribosylamino)uracil reductase
LKNDKIYMNRAIRLARKGAGWINPNPMVGAVLVKDDRIIGEGYHEYFGGPHAEVNAIAAAGDSARGSTLYVTLEPCSHQGKTPPCTQLIAGKGIRKVVIGMKDPNPLVNGKGIEFLRSSDIEVVADTPGKEILRLNEVFIKFITTGLPFCTLKTAMTLDGKTATVTNAARWISGEVSRKLVHELRQEYSAVLAGIDTIVFDNPLMTTRRSGKKSRNALKVVADSTGKIPLSAKVLQNEPQLLILATTGLADTDKLTAIERMGAQVLICPVKENRVDLPFLFRSLGVMGIDSILLEGGSTLAFTALKEGLVDKIISFIAPKILGGKGAPTPVGGEGLQVMEEAIPVRRWEFKKLGEDIMIEGYLDRTGSEGDVGNEGS